MVEIEVIGVKYTIKKKLKWNFMKKIVTAMNHQNIGELMTHAIVGACINPKFTYQSIEREDGEKIIALGYAIIKSLDIDQEKILGIEKKDDNLSD